jgi:dihydrofolate synthase/folylpolyglutamate synthase
MDYLGPTREHIGYEKAGIMRGGRPAVCGDADPPASLVQHAAAIGAKLVRIGVDFGYAAEAPQWRYFGPAGPRHGLPLPALRGAHQLGNAATALAALGEVRERLPVSGGAIRSGLAGVELAGRFTVLPGRPVVVLDVAHNPHAARVLAATLGSMGYHAETIGVFGMLRDKDIDGVVRAMHGRIDRWFVGSLPGPRGCVADDMGARLAAAGVHDDAIRRFPDIVAAWREARSHAAPADRIVVFGSFLTVAAALADSCANGAPLPPNP